VHSAVADVCATERDKFNICRTGFY